MPRFTVRPAGIELEAFDGESVAEAAWRQDYVWPTKCWGQIECMTCFTTIVDGELDAVPAEDAELDAIRSRLSPKYSNDSRVRLGCQLKCRGSGLVVEKRGVRPIEAQDNNAVSPDLGNTIHTNSGAQ
ncbi:2Fe-2S iron-sulfur cluster-binding protein [Rhodococcus sp. P1Y]|uniref:2Fe-2S iron-sulfur cluster-binding protein n=1 Tax=Rhodococcus sp. P1Y TaxID=1302308 RepID=UPI000EB4E46D|nr:2Fe-2S iron-sulfur cluster-binding protein [Rhodococcus sp. P1Y]AYJ50317.1 ferredoxin [Rhodococcus sp. P1Y]